MENFTFPSLTLIFYFFGHKHRMNADTSHSSRPQWCIALHGGAGVIERGYLSEIQEKQIRMSLAEALQAGISVLSANQQSCRCEKNMPNQLQPNCTCSVALDAVEAAVVTLEESPWFNAGKGSVFTADGTHELDASIMEGRYRRAGAIGGLKKCRNPIRGARMVMEKTEHVFLVGDAADQFLASHGLETVNNDWFDTEIRRNQWNAALTGNPIAVASRKRGQSISSDGEPSFTSAAISEGVFGEKKFGTVGAVAIDCSGNVAAATSTGGMTNKKFGRVGDSPVIGAGTWADNRFCAVSATGHGEHFIQNAVAHDIASRVRYLGETVEEACRHIISVGDLKIDGGEGGVVAIDPKTRSATLSFNSPGMYRAWTDKDGTIHTAIFGDEH